jgi:hypothetical protein
MARHTSDMGKSVIIEGGMGRSFSFCAAASSSSFRLRPVCPSESRVLTNRSLASRLTFSAKAADGLPRIVTHGWSMKYLQCRSQVEYSTRITAGSQLTFATKQPIALPSTSKGYRSAPNLGNLQLDLVHSHCRTRSLPDNSLARKND